MKGQTREQLQERMHPEHSEMERFITNKLRKAGKAVSTDLPFCVEQTIPDQYILPDEVALYLDGPVHKGREDRDEELRAKLSKRRGIKVASISYENASKKEKLRVWNEVKGLLGIEENG